LCKHASDKRTSNTLSASETCSGQICNSVLGLVRNRLDHGIRIVVAPVTIEILVPLFQDRARASQFRDVRSTKSILPFDPLISTLRI
jgi:hypothetical protein